MVNVTVDTSFGPSNQVGKLYIPPSAKNDVTLNPLCKSSPQQQIQAILQTSAPFHAWLTLLPVLGTFSSQVIYFDSYVKPTTKSDVLNTHKIWVLQSVLCH